MSEIEQLKSERRERLAEWVMATVEALGSELSAPALEIFKERLSFLPDDVIKHALLRCQRELRGRNGYPPTLSLGDVLDRAGVLSETAIEEAEARAAWDVVMELKKRGHIARDAEGVYRKVARVRRTGETRVVPERMNSLVRIGRRMVCFCRTVHIVESIPSPELDRRIEDTIRRIGGWDVLMEMDLVVDQPHVQRRFFEEFRAWQAVEAVFDRGALPTSVTDALRQLSGSKAMERPRGLKE